MERSSPIFLLCVFVASLSLSGITADPKSATSMKVYNLAAEEDVRACAFTPHGHGVAIVHLTDRSLSKKSWNVMYTSHLALWNFRTGDIEEKAKWEYTSNDQGDSWPIHPRYVEYAADGRHLVVFDEAALRVFDAVSYVEVRRVMYKEPQETFPNDGWTIAGFSVAGDGSRAAVAISSTIGSNGGFVRIYDLETGQVVREWRLHDRVGYVAGVALSRDGERVAVSVLPTARSSDPESFVPTGTDNVLVMDVRTGKTITGVNTKYFAGPVVFGPNNTLLTASINDDRKGYSLDTIKVWDAGAGTLLREIVNRHGGIHYRLNFSSDARLLLGYTGTEKSIENFVTVDTQRFQIWDFASGNVVASSPTFGPNKGTIPEMRISPDGSYVVVWWGNGFGKPFVYSIPQY